MARADADAPTAAAAPLILFDGDCNLCNGSVQFVLRRDVRARFRFASLQSAAGREVLAGAGFEGPPPESIVLVEPRPGGPSRVATKSTAALRIAVQLRWPWPLLAVFFVLPRFLRDAAYDFVARHRYRWFGRRDTCMVPAPALRARFLDADERPAGP